MKPAANETKEALFPEHDNHSLKVEDLVQVYRDSNGRNVLALDSVSFSIEKPEIVGVIGPSGCGKSTLLRMLAGLDKPYAGSIVFDEKLVEGASYQRSLVFQNANLFDWYTVEENISFGLKARDVYRKEAWKVSELIALMNLEGFEKSYPSQISGGMASRCALARSFVQNPGLVLLDEPLAALDALTRGALQQEIIEMQRMAHNIVILVTHDIEEALFVCDRILVLSSRPGRIVAEVVINMAHPRDRMSDEFVAARREVFSLLES